jgi:hypothetical protein
VTGIQKCPPAVTVHSTTAILDDALHALTIRRARDGAAAGKSRQRQSAAQLSMNHFVSASIKENNTNAAAK